jgi:O-antigen ligase
MPEHLKTLVVILTLAVGVFVLAKGPACARAIADKDFVRRRNVWFALTLTVFLAHNFWLYIIVAAALLTFVRRSDPNTLALYFFVLFAVPSVYAEIPGFGIVNYLFEIDYLRLLALTVLLPAYLHLRRQPDTEPFGRLLTDKLIVAYLILAFVQMLEFAPFTTTLRKGLFYPLIEVFLPYYVGSRYLKTLEQFRDALMSFVVAALVLSAILFAEFALYWMLYPSVQLALGAPWGWGNYLMRAGNLRAAGSVGHAIIAGYVIAVAAAFYLYARKSVPSKALWGLGLLLIIAGLIGPLSRGPWLGAAAMLFVIIATGRAPVLAFARWGLAGLACLPLLATPKGQVIIDHLPFIGTVDAENVVVRQRLAEASFQVFLERPLLGSYDFLETPAMQALRGNDGIIDLVNTYVIVGLGGGIVGLALFLGFFLTSLLAIYRGMRRLADRTEETYVLGQTLLAALLGVLLIIATVSPVLVIPTIYWCLGGMGIAYGRMLQLGKAPSASRTTAPARPAALQLHYPLRRSLLPWR